MRGGGGGDGGNGGLGDEVCFESVKRVIVWGIRGRSFGCGRGGDEGRWLCLRPNQTQSAQGNFGRSITSRLLARAMDERAACSCESLKVKF